MIWWASLNRQQRVGWTLLIASVLYLLYFFKARLVDIGPPIERKEWMYAVGACIGVMLGTINIRMAEMRIRNQKILPLVPPTKQPRKK